jgi:hypothetical protein
MSNDLEKSTGLDRDGNPDPTAFDRQGNWYDPYLAWYDFYKENPKEEVAEPKVEAGFVVDGVKWGIWFPDGLPPVERNK